MAEQPGQLAEVSGLPNVSLRVAPFSAGGASWSDVGPRSSSSGSRSTGTGGKVSPRRCTRTGSPEGCTWTSRRRWSCTRRRAGAMRNCPRRPARSRSVTEFRGAVAPDPPFCIGTIPSGRSARAAQNCVLCRVHFLLANVHGVQQHRTVAPGHDMYESGLRDRSADFERSWKLISIAALAAPMPAS